MEIYLKYFCFSKENAEKIKSEARTEIETLTPDVMRLVEDVNRFTGNVTTPENLTLQHKLKLDCLRAWALKATNETSCLKDKLSRADPFLTETERVMFSNFSENISLQVEEVNRALNGLKLLNTLTKRSATTSIGRVIEDTQELQKYLELTKVRFGIYFFFNIFTINQKHQKRTSKS